MNLTAAQKRVYTFIKGYLDAHGYSPSYEDIQKNLGFKSLASVTKHLKQLESRGYIRSPWSNKKRALELVPIATAMTRSIPFLGTVAAGTPIEAVEVPDSIEVPNSLLRGGNNFALRVRGDSMIDEGIREGDIVIINKQPHAENGETVIAQIGGEATVKKFYQKGNEIELRPANSKMESIRVPSDEVEVIGVVVGLLRHYR